MVGFQITIANIDEFKFGDSSKGSPYMYMCVLYTSMKYWQLQRCQTTKLNFLPNFPAIRYQYSTTDPSKLVTSAEINTSSSEGGGYLFQYFSAILYVRTCTLKNSKEGKSTSGLGEIPVFPSLYK